MFTNLFRGEMLDKSLRFYLLAPVPHPMLVLGKYLAGLFATSVIFSLSTALQFAAMLRGFYHAPALLSRAARAGGADGRLDVDRRNCKRGIACSINRQRSGGQAGD